MKSLVTILSSFLLFTTVKSYNFRNVTSSSSWLTSGLEQFEASIPIPHYQDTFDLLVDDNFYGLAFLTWQDENGFLPKLFKLTVKSSNPDGKIFSKECDIEPPSVDESGWIVPKSVTYLKYDRVLLCWQGGSNIYETEETQTKFQVIFTKTCQSNQYTTIKTPKDSVSGPGIIIVKLKNTFDFIFHQSTIAPVFYYKWSFDHNGTPLQSTPKALTKNFPEVSKFSHLTNIYPLSNGDYIFIGKGIENQNIYSSLSGWVDAEKIYYSDHSFSNSSGFATICWKLKLKPGLNQIRCKCLEESCRRDYSLTIKNQMFHHFEEFSIHNKPDGRVLLLTEIYMITNSKVLLIIDETQSDGKCRRLGIFELPGNLDRIELSITDHHRYCFFFITHIHSLVSTPPRLNQFSIECLQILNDNASTNGVACGAIDYGNRS